MKSFPEWVPEEVIAYYRDRCEQKKYTAEYEQRGTAALCRAMESENMRIAWKQIAKRKDKVPPICLARAIAMAPFAADQISSVPSSQQLKTFRKLTSEVQALCPKFEDAFGQLENWALRHSPEVRPDKAVQELADNMEEFTSMLEDARKWLTDQTGKPRSKNAKRTFIIRFLSERMNAWYGTPLHRSVAAATEAILGEAVDPHLVRKITAYSKNS